MTDVAVAAGVSQGLAYRYFSDKDDLVRALVSEAVQRADAGGSPLAWPGSAAERLRRLVTRLVEARRAEPQLFLLFQHVTSDPATPPDLLELIHARGRAVTQAMRQLVTEAQSAGEAARDGPDQLVTAVMACLDGLGRLALGRPGQAAEHFPAAGIITRMLQLPQPQQPQQPGEPYPDGHDLAGSEPSTIRRSA